MKNIIFTVFMLFLTIQYQISEWSHLGFLVGRIYHMTKPSKTANNNFMFITGCLWGLTNCKFRFLQLHD